MTTKAELEEQVESLQHQLDSLHVALSALWEEMRPIKGQVHPLIYDHIRSIMESHGIFEV